MSQIVIQMTEQQTQAINLLVEKNEDYDAWIDFVTTTNEGIIYVMFTNSVYGDKYYTVSIDGCVYGTEQYENENND